MTEYAETPAGRFRGYMGRLSGKQPTDPARRAGDSLRQAGENPPLRLALGVMRKKIANLQQDIAAWGATRTSVAFPRPETQTA